jgi:phage gp37-like protein
VNDSIYHPFDKSGQRHMEYVHQRGAFDDLPLAQIVADFQAVYSGWLDGAGGSGKGTTSALHGASFANDVEQETAR